ncbi:MAG TPA: hypothetical protein VKZ79_13570 [Alphaproteobacteria bacterium]|nr:hypothetical protein [Alphaproteobacteria bacterium]
MEFAFTAEQKLLQETARDLFAAKGVSTEVRRLIETDAGFPPSAGP